MSSSIEPLMMRIFVFAPAFHFRGGVLQPGGDLLFSFRAALHQASAQFFEIGRHDKDVDKRILDETGRQSARMVAAPLVSMSIEDTDTTAKVVASTGSRKRRRLAASEPQRISKNSPAATRRSNSSLLRN